MIIDKTAEKQRGRPFKKGQSGNPAGRPKGSKNFDTLFEAAIKRIVKEKKLPIKDPEMELVVKAVVEALKGNYPFFRDIMDRRYGRPKQPISGVPDEPIKISWEK